MPMKMVPKRHLGTGNWTSVADPFGPVSLSLHSSLTLPTLLYFIDLYCILSRFGWWKIRIFHQGTTTPQAIDLELDPPNELPPRIPRNPSNGTFLNMDCSEMIGSKDNNNNSFISWSNKQELLPRPPRTLNFLWPHAPPVRCIARGRRLRGPIVFGDTFAAWQMSTRSQKALELSWL